MNVNLNPAGIAELTENEQLAKQLLPAAQKILGKAQRRAPHWLDPQWFVRAGVGPRGAFAQAVARGSGTELAEYGGSRSPAYAYMRSSAR